MKITVCHVTEFVDSFLDHLSKESRLDGYTCKRTVTSEDVDGDQGSGYLLFFSRSSDVRTPSDPLVSGVTLTVLGIDSTGNSSMHINEVRVEITGIDWGSDNSPVGGKAYFPLSSEGSDALVKEVLDLIFEVIPIEDGEH